MNGPFLLVHWVGKQSLTGASRSLSQTIQVLAFTLIGSETSSYL